MRYLVILCCCLWGLSSQGQTSDSLFMNSIPRYTVKVGVWPLFNSGKRALDIGADLRIADRWLADLELGFIFQSVNFANNDGEFYRGIRARPGIRYDLGGINMGLMYKFEYVWNNQYVNVARQGGTYIESYLADRRVMLNGLQLRMDKAFPLSLGGRWILEPFVRIGMQHAYVDRNLPGDAIIDEDDFNDDFNAFQFADGNTITLDFYFGINIGLAWWGKNSNSSKKRRRRRK